MKKILSILSVFAILLSTNIFAQNQADLPPTKVKVYKTAEILMNPQADAQEVTSRLNTQLSLNSTQESTIYQINLETAQKRLALSDLQDKDSEAFVAAVMDLYRARNVAIESVLTTKQKLAFKQTKESMMARRVDAE